MVCYDSYEADKYVNYNVKNLSKIAALSLFSYNKCNGEESVKFLYFRSLQFSTRFRCELKLKVEIFKSPEIRTITSNIKVKYDTNILKKICLAS